jgi:hypothetical protein
MDRDGEKSALVFTATFLIPAFFWTGVLFASVLQLHEKIVELLISLGAAVGTVSAVIVALSVGKRQVAAALDAVERSHLIAVRVKQQSILAVAEAAFRHSEVVRQIFACPEPQRTQALLNEYHKVTTDVIIAALDRVPAHDVGIATGIAPFLRLRYRFDILHGTIVDYQTKPKQTADLANLRESHPTPEMQKQIRGLIEGDQVVRAESVVRQLNLIATDYQACKTALASI